MDLDTSWIEKEEKINSIQQHYVRELAEKVNLHYVYIDANDSIERVEKEAEVLTDSNISKERMLQIIQTKRMPPARAGNKPTKYKLLDILAFQVHLDPEKIFSFSKTENENLNEYSQSFLRSIPLFDDITLVPSIFIFHEINSIYFFFKATSSPPLHSILKNDSDYTKKENRITKKVRISLETEDVPPAHPKTLKTRPKIANYTRKNKSVLQ